MSNKKARVDEAAASSMEAEDDEFNAALGAAGDVRTPGLPSMASYLQPPSADGSLAVTFSSRVGEQFQARVPDAVSATAAASAAAASSSSSAAAASSPAAAAAPSSSLTSLVGPLEGTPVWLSHRVKDSNKVDSYLRAIDELFYRSTEHFDEERALELLHRCNYDSAAALELAQPWAKTDGETDEIDAVNGGMKAEFDSDDMCSVCGDGGDLIICDAKGCKKVYHAVCAELSEVPQGTWECSVHFCQTCGQRVNDANSVRCSSCPSAFCAAHIPAYARQSANQIKHVDFKCPRCAGSKEGSTHSDRRGFLTQLMAALNGAPVHSTGKDHRPMQINLKDLYREITVRGGLEEVLTSTGWKEIQRIFFHPTSHPKPPHSATHK